MDYRQRDIDVILHAIKISKLVSDGHFTLMKFTTNWRFGFSTASDREDIQELFEGKSIYEAVQKAIERKKDENR